MSATKSETVKVTGATAGAILVGSEAVNQGLCIRIHNDQPPDHGGRIGGPFDLLDAGTGPYAHYLADVVGHTFQTTNELIDLVAHHPGAEQCKHILNANLLTIGA
jgi:hypothetical protein